MKVKTYNVSFWNMAGESLGTVEVSASTPNKAKVMASSLYACSWVTQTVTPA